MKKILSILLAVSLIFCSLPFFNQTDALETYQTVTKYHLDMGAIHVWSSDNGATWQNDLVYGATPSDPFTASLTFSDKITKVVDAYVLDEDEFEWADTTGIYTFNEVEDYLTSQDSYEKNYKRYMSSSISSVKATKSGDYTVDISYKAKLKGLINDYNLSDMLNRDKFDDIIALLGGEGAVKQDLYDKLEAGEYGVGEGVLGYMFFMPIVIEYQTVEKVTIEEDEFYAGLNVPSSALVGESFDVIDESVFGDESQFACTTLTYCVDNGTTKTVTGWTGAKLGDSISQSFDEECTVKYTIKAWNIYGKDSEPVSKTINISSEEEAEIEVEPDLILPEYTYEGHTELAKDESVFTVNGVSYSATRTYAEGLASNSFKADDSSIGISRLTDTKAECTFPEKGTYDITLTVKPDGGGRASDTESIEVRKTPYIKDNLSGFQKQNRKQILTATVATYPGKPLTDYSVTLKDKKTGESVTLTPDNLQENNTTIKTRAVTMTQDVEKGFAYITVEFLTKTPSYFSAGAAPQDFYYEINVKDSKGDTDAASKTFDVSPDIPPTAAISLDSAFLRNEGTNVATIKVEDVTVAADGDRVERKWYYGTTAAPSSYTDVSKMDGYSKLSFGTDKTAGFNAVGVGKFTTKLFVKEVWTEPTLEEYVADSDYLTDTEIAYSEVQNVAPIVSLELLSSTEQEILLLANNDSEYQALLNNKTALQQELLKNQIDGQIIIKKLIGNTPLGVAGIKEQLNYSFPAPVWNHGIEDDISADVSTTDSEKTYLAVWTAASNSLTVPVTVHAYNPYAGEVWSYTTNKDEPFSFGNDDTGKYLYLIYKTSNQTVLLDKRTGAVAGTINMALSDKVWITDNLMFIVQSGNLYAINQNTLTKTLVEGSVSAVSRVAGNLQYITKSEAGVVRNILDMETLSVEKQLLVDTGNGVSSPNYYMVFCIDSTGKVVLLKETGKGTDTFNGVIVYNSDNSLQKQITCPVGFTGDGYDLDISYTLDESGVCNHVVVWTEDNTGVNTHFLRGVNLNTGVIGSWSKRTDALNSIGFNSMFEVGGKSYFYYNGWYYTGESGYWGPSYVFVFNGTTLLPIAAGVGKIDNADENYQSSDRIITSLFSNNTAGVLQMKISSFPKTLAQETKELISKFSDKLTFLGGINTTANEIKAVAEAPRPAIKVTAAQNGYLSMPNQALIPNKKYYYEYEIKPLTEETESKLNGIAASTGSTTSNQRFNSHTLYVTNSYEEDFNSGTINKFFAVDNGGRFVDGKFGAYYNGSKDNDNYVKLSFTVPSGKQAILTTDYDLNFNNAYHVNRINSYYADTNVFVDGKTIRDTNIQEYEGDDDTSAQWFQKREKQAVFYKILGAGTHTIECKVGDTGWYNIFIDNLRVDILSAVPNSNSTTFNSHSGNDKGWYSLEGSFKTSTKVISYDSQSSSTYYGGLPGAVIKYYQDDPPKWPDEIEYYQTVPAGYIQKGKLHLGSTYLVGYSNYMISGFKKIQFRDDDYGITNYWWKLAPKTAGVYTHLADARRGDKMSCWIDYADLVQYPDNEVTRTNNMAFNDANTEYFFPKVSSNKLTNLSIYLPKGEYLIKNLKMYYMEDGRKVYLQHEDCEELADLSKWSLSTGLSTSIVTQTEEEPDDEFVKIYKKGEKVLYNIFYSDYEKDPSKTGYWVYSHINWPPDTVHPDVGKILTAPIDRFYLSGKYTVTHWEVDNTQRTGTVGDATPYNKESNKVTMTFYVDGEGAAPWITYIKTDPSKVKENNGYTIQVGVDDTEKDTLALTTEVYLNGTLIKTDLKTGLEAYANGDYPEQTISGLPAAKVGVYQIICTVSDYSGVGIKSYKFTVVSEGKITGAVSHTVQWDANRKTYNLKRFSEEVNRELQLNDYVAMTVPRKRGTNVFWSGEQFVLNSETEGFPTRVTAQIFSVDESGTPQSTGYSTELSKTGKKTASGAELWAGNLWDEGMINQWGGSTPEELTFIFTAHYNGGTTKTHAVSVIVDNNRDYWQLHRLW